MYNVSVARKVCATCKWWRAERELEFSGAREPRYVVVDNIAPSGHPCAAWAQLLINCVAFLLPDVVPLVDEMGMTLVSVAGIISRRLMPMIMRIVYWILGIGAVIALPIILGVAVFAD